MNDSSRTVRLNEFPQTEGAILAAVYQKVKYTERDGKWREFKGKVMVKGRPYDVQIVFMLNGSYLTIKDSHVENFHESLILPPSYN